MSSSLKAVTLTLLALALFSTAPAAPSSAGHAGECYEAVPPKPVHRKWVRRDILLPGLYEVTRTPPLYGFRKRKVLTDPGEVVWHEEPPVYRTVPKKVKIAGGYTWKYCSSGGREIKCKVREPARYEVVEKRVLVHPGRRWAKRTPPKFAYVTERVLLRPYRNVNNYHPAEVHWHKERVTIQPEGYRWAPTRAKPDC